MRRLAPPLSVIEADLFDPSPDLVRRWMDGDPGIPVETQAALDADPEAQALAAALREPPSDALDPPHGPSPELPGRLAELVDARLKTADLKLSTIPRPGLILRIDEVIGPNGPLGWDMAQPLVVLLSEPAGHEDLWYGWLVSAETDYACHWDLVLEALDEPHDPLAAMAQAWNPVHVYVPTASAALGALAPARLAAVRDLAVAVLMDHPDPTDADPGTLVQRTTSGGHLVLTGTPLGDGTDPRWRYHELYFAAADLLRDLARLALRDLAPAPAWWQQVIASLQSAAENWRLPLVPVPQLVMGTAPAEMLTSGTWRLGDLIDVEVIPAATGDAIQIHATRRAVAPVSVSLIGDGQVRQRKRLDEAHPEADLFAGAGEGLALAIHDTAENLLFQVRLSDGPPSDAGG